MNENILAELRKPFHPAHITWKPGTVRQDGTAALALAYADLRAYQNRLDEIAGMDWSVTYTPWGERIVCHLTIHGITRSSSGEPDSQAERSEIAGTAAEAQAFKRACAMFGLGRYLYNLPSVWVEYDANTRQFTDKAKAKLEGIIVQHYRRHLEDNQENNDSGDIEIIEDLSPLRQQVDELGKELYGEQWVQVARHNVDRITYGASDSIDALMPSQLQRLIDGMKKLQRKRGQVSNGL